MMTMVIKIKSHRKDTDQTCPGGNVCVHVCVFVCDYMRMCVCAQVCLHMRVRAMQLQGKYSPKGQILELRFLMSPEIYRTEEFAIFVQ